MAFEDDMIVAGHTKIAKQRFYAELDDSGNIKGEIREYPDVDCNGDPIDPHVWIPKGKRFRCYTDSDKTAIENKIKTKQSPDIEVGASEMERLR